MFRIGQSTDIHQLCENRKLILGGVEIEHTKGLLGHSDADALLHAIGEAILGALALGDLGKHFPDTDERFKNADSLLLLAEVVKKMEAKGYQIGNIDSTILIEKPKMAPHIDTMRRNIANVCKCSMDQVSVKATRGEKLGFVGHEEGVAATAIVLLEKRKVINMEKVRVRYAPSPTGFLHIGNARTAMFNYLFAKHYNGDFVLRIEDTDIERNVEGGEESQMHYLNWLGMVPDESPVNPGKYGPYRQMERLHIYKEVVDELLAKGLAYKCFCTPEELAEVKEAQQAAGVAPMYNRKCADLTPEEVAEKEAAGLPYVIRLKVPAGKTYAWNDMIRGKIAVESKDIGDWVIVKSNGIPTYNFAVVIDDHTMEISHVFRGEEHISNTPKQLMIFDMMGWEAPQYGHMTLIVNEQHKKLSKRDHSIMQYVSQYDEAGYLPEAMFNFMALLGWSPEGTEEIFTKEELIEQFSEKRLSKSPSMFDKNKLAWVNNRYIKKMTLEECAALCIPFLREAYDCEGLSDEWLTQVVALYHEQLSYGQEIVGLAELFFKKDFELSEEAKEVMTWETQPTVMAEFKKNIEALSDEEWTGENIWLAIKKVQKDTGIKGKPLFMGIRVVTTSEVHGPELKDAIAVIGKAEILRRLNLFL